MKLDLKEYINKMLYKIRHVDHYGAIAGEAISDVNLTTGTSWKNLGSITLPSGVWILTAGASFAQNATGYRLFTISSSSTSGGAILAVARNMALNGSATNLEVTTIATGGTYYFNGCQNSGSTLTVQTRYSAIKLADALGSNLKP